MGALGNEGSFRQAGAGAMQNATIENGLPGIRGTGRVRVIVMLAVMHSCVAGLLRAEDTAAPDAVAQANNPLANFTAVNVHNYYIGKLTDVDDKDANQAWLRIAKPFNVGKSLWLMRASLPFNSFPTGPSLDTENGLGDLNVFAACLIDTGNPGITAGVGPQITVPTATEDALGSEKWSPGAVATFFDMRSKRFQYGCLLSWSKSVAGDDDREDVNLAAFQPFMFYQLGRGLHLRSSAVTAYNIENDDYSVPVGLGVGQVIPTRKAVFNLFIEPQYSVADEGAGWPEWQVFMALNTQLR
jgi:hypothetical protein